MNTAIIKSYADVIVKVGCNVQKGQTVIVRGEFESIELVRAVVDRAYQVGAKFVKVDLSDDDISRSRYLYSDEAYLASYPQYMADMMAAAADDDLCLINIITPNPDLFADIDAGKLAAANKAGSIAMMDFRTKMTSGSVSWCVVAHPSKAWANKIYPDLSQEEGLEKLWKDVIHIARLDTEDPAKAWADHSKGLKDKIQILHDLKIKSLHYLAPGTDLVVDLPEDHIWEGGASFNTASKVDYMPNIPTEEVFTMPHKLGVNGTLKSTMPLIYNGATINGFDLVFKEGKVVDFTAEEGYDVLENMLNMDDGARYLGEVALVPVTSPIYQTGTVFANTLFDENASCHFALGRCYPDTIKGGTSLSPEDLEKVGGNDSLIHVDFMVGSEALNITATTLEGKEIAIFKNGNWAI